MSLLEEGLHDVLTADAGVSARVSSRVFPVILPQAPTYPAVTYQRISGPRLHEHDGTTGLVDARIQVDAWSTEYSEAKALSDDIRAALDGFRGDMLDVTVASTRHVGDQDLYDEDVKVHHVASDYMVSYEE